MGKLRVVLTVVVFALFPAILASADNAAIVAEVTQAKVALDQAFQDRDATKIEAMVTPDHLSVTSYYGVPFTTDDQLATLAEFDAHYFDFTEPTVTVFSEDSAMVTFENSYVGTFQGRPLPSRVFVSEIWQKQNGTWLQGLYQETPIAP
jgi:Domain of unknown function (DUF4440)